MARGRRSRAARKGAYRGEDRNSATMEDVVALVDGPRPGRRRSAAKRWLADNGSLAVGTPRAAYRHDLVHGGVRAGVYPTRCRDPAHRELGAQESKY
jgi:hypothetical protein